MKMHFRKIAGVMLAIGVLCSMLVSFSSCGSNAAAEPVVTDNTDEFEVIRAAADKFLSVGGADREIMAEEVHTLINDDDPNNDPRIMDNRNNNTWNIGHVCGSKAIPWHQIFLTLQPGSFEDTYFYEHDAVSTNEKLVIINYTGMEGGGTLLAALSMLGYDVVKMKWGYNQWQFCPNASPGAFFSVKTGLGRMTGLDTSGAFVSGFWAIGMNYPTETTENTATQTYEFPVVDNTDSGETFEVIRAAANAVAQKQAPLTQSELSEGGWEQKHKWWPTDIIPENVFNAMYSSNPPFILSVQPRELYDKGHIPGAVWFDIETIMQTENLSRIPTDRQVVVVCNDGQRGTTVAAILRMLGYDAVNLLFGMMAWTESDDVVTGRFHVYEEDMVTFKDVLSFEVCWTDIPDTNVLPPMDPDYKSPEYAVPDDPNAIFEGTDEFS
jgi:rhodanese-related sulfurtransferase